jgi:hypothetical protein
MFITSACSCTLWGSVVSASFQCWPTFISWCFLFFHQGSIDVSAILIGMTCFGYLQCACVSQIKCMDLVPTCVQESQPCRIVDI